MLDDNMRTRSSATSRAFTTLRRVGSAASFAALLASLWAAPALAADERRGDEERLKAMGFGSLLEGERIDAASAAPIAVLGLDHEQRSDATVIGIVGAEPLLAHTVYASSSDTLVLEITGVDVSRLPSVAEVGTPQVSRVSVASAGGSAGRATFTVTRSPDTRHAVAIDPRDSRRLTLTITSIGGASTRAGSSEGIATERGASRRRGSAAAPAAKPQRVLADETGRPGVMRSPGAGATVAPGVGSATPGVGSAAPGVGSAAPGVARLVDARITSAADGRVMLRLVGSRALQARPFTLDNPPRLVIDLPMTLSEVSEPRLQVAGDGVLGVRIAQNQPLPSPLTRIIVDLEETVEWELVPGPDALVIALGDGASPFGAAPTMARAATPAPAPARPSAALTTSSGASGAAAPERAPAETSRTSRTSTSRSSLVTEARTDAGALASLGRPATFTGQPAPSASRMRETQASVGGALASSPLLQTGGVSGGSFETVTIGQAGPVYAGEPISINLKGADLEDLFRLFAEVADLNIILDPSVRGKQMTLVLDDVPWDQALALVLKTQNLGSSLEGNVLRVAPLAKLAQEEQQKKQLEEARELSGTLTSIARTLSYASSSAAEQIVTESLSARGSIVTDDRTNTLIIKDLEDRMPEIESLLDLIDQPTQQVMIEARIVETTQDFSKGWGIQWGFNYIADRAFGNQTGFSFPRSVAADYAVNLPVAGATTSLGLAFRNILNTFALDIAISALEDRGRARIISRPMVMVQNNEEAEIESGIQIPITTTTATEIDVTFVSASLSLTVTPQITADDNVIMELEVENNQPTFLTGNAETASIATREASTVVRVPNGGTTVIGGIYQVNESATSGRTPFLSRIPLIGWLFRNKRIDRTNDELLIFVTPRIQED